MYTTLKFIHILTATLLLVTVVNCGHQWFKSRTQTSVFLNLIQKQNTYLVFPVLLLQLFSGFSLISLKHYDFHEFWIIGSIICFLGLLGCWFIFIYCTVKEKLKTVQAILLAMVFLLLLCMIYLMANKI